MLLCSPLLGADAPQIGGATPIQWSIRMADAQFARRGEAMKFVDGETKKWDYADNVFLLSMIRLGHATSQQKYAQNVDSVLASFIEPTGDIKGFKLEDYNLDNINGGKTIFAMFNTNQDDGYKHAIEKLRQQLDNQPRTASGGYWHKQIYPNQMWLDGLYMSGPFRAEYAKSTEDAAMFDDIVKQFTLVAEHTYDEKTGLFHHGWDESKQQSWADKQTGASPSFWSRAMGWYAMAIVDTLDYLPADHPGRAKLIDRLKTLAAGIQKYQDPDSGVWWQVTHEGSREGNYLESTASCMFVYTLAKAINNDYLGAEYKPVVEKGYRGIISKFLNTDGGTVTLTKCCSVAGLGNGRDGTFEYYIREPIVDNDMKGVGPFILAGIEMEKFFAGK